MTSLKSALRSSEINCEFCFESGLDDQSSAAFGLRKNIDPRTRPLRVLVFGCFEIARNFRTARFIQNVAQKRERVRLRKSLASLPPGAVFDFDREFSAQPRELIGELLEKIFAFFHHGKIDVHPVKLDLRKLFARGRSHLKKLQKQRKRRGSGTGSEIEHRKFSVSASVLKRGLKGLGMQLKRGDEFRCLKRQKIKQVSGPKFWVVEIFGNSARPLLGENFGELFDAAKKNRASSLEKGLFFHDSCGL